MSKQTDISQQIRKYLNGELDGRAMNQFEREALNDPFVMDALEGYAIAGADQHANLDELSDRIRQKVQPGTTGRIVRWRTISIAASLIGALIAVAGIWVIKDQPEKKEKKLALAQKIEVLKSPTTSLNRDTTTEMITGEGNAIVQQPVEGITSERREPGAIRNIQPQIPAAPESEVVADAASQKSSESASLEETIVLNYKKEAEQDKSKVKAAARADSADNVLPGRAAMIASQDAEKKEKTLSQDTKAPNIISGTITDAAGPLPGVRVRVKGTDITSITDVRGRFKLPVEQPKRLVLDVNMIGYLNKQVKVDPKDSIKIALMPKQATSGGVITGYGEEQCCWDVYEKYLKDNAISPDGKTGTVKLTFMVNPDNSLSDFNIIKGISEETDKKAIEIVKNGPPWVHDQSGKPKKVTLKVKFDAKK